MTGRVRSRDIRVSSTPIDRLAEIKRRYKPSETSFQRKTNHRLGHRRSKPRSSASGQFGGGAFDLAVSRVSAEEEEKEEEEKDRVDEEHRSQGINEDG